MKQIALALLILASTAVSHGKPTSALPPKEVSGARAKATLPAEAREILTEQGSAIPAEVESAAVATPAKTEAKNAETPVAAPIDAKANLKESEIPLNLYKKKETASESSPVARFFLGILLVGAMAGGAFFYLRKHAKPGQRKNAPQIKVLSQHWLGPKKSLAIVRVAGESVLIGVTDHNISMIKSLALLDEDVPSEAPEKFDEVLEESETRSTRTPSPREQARTITSVEDEDFQMGGLNQIKDAVQRRLKGMRNWQ